MDSRNFDSFVEHTHQQCRKILTDRAQFYADHDRFRNFKNVERITGTNKYHALQGMFMKHFEAWLNFCEKPPLTTPYDQWEEKIIDMINYLTLCLGMVKEDYEDGEGAGQGIKLQEVVSEPGRVGRLLNESDSGHISQVEVSKSEDWRPTRKG